MTDTIVKVSGLRGGYGTQDVIQDISFDVRKGEILGIIGPNGSGKSTLLRLMTRVLNPKEGCISIEGTDIAGMNSKAFARKVACVPQDTVINFAFSVWEIVLMGRIPHLGRMQLETKKDFAVAEYALTVTDTLSIKDKNIESLSSGERQRAVIAKALAQEPAMLFLDEPTSHLDIGHQMMILDLLKKLNRERGLTIITVLHDLNRAGEYCDSLILLDKGRIFKQGAPDEVLTYQNIEKVYKTVVVVKKNSLSSRPLVLPIPGRQLRTGAIPGAEGRNIG